eukprot:TRINITY_DN51470_c0_g1_i1.p1 TRINITY_DN51470_c0_g1~~TRINITY_DN51470_c0_g1_i1.p1  ORF type:complete len:204 (+),score=35.47 TRINITY_DN51470_c0_g1_i1:204-815(+)
MPGEHEVSLPASAPELAVFQAASNEDGSGVTRAVSVPPRGSRRSDHEERGCIDSDGNLKRPRLYETIGPAIEAMPPREALRVLDRFEERLLDERNLQLEANVDHSLNDQIALQEHADALKKLLCTGRELAKCKLEKEELEAEVEAMRSRSDDATCVICLTGQASHILVPCGHLAICRTCCLWPLERCPLCRRVCELTIPVSRP